MNNRKFIISMDDKKYLCPGTSTGMTSIRNQKILTSSDPEAARKYPKYDWPISLVNVTPATYRVMTKEVQNQEDKEVIVRTEDDTMVSLRPKHFVGSSGSVWFSEQMTLRYNNETNLFDVPNGTDYSKSFRSVCNMVKDKIAHFMEATTKEDVKSVTINDNCVFKQYEQERIHSFEIYLNRAMDMYLLNFQSMCDDEQKKLEELHVGIIKLLKTISTVNTCIDQKSGIPLWLEYQKLIDVCKNIIQLFTLWDLPLVKSRIMEFTDGGPGVGVNNIDVKVRTCERFLIWNTDYFIRHHLANDDSSQN